MSRDLATRSSPREGLPRLPSEFGGPVVTPPDDEPWEAVPAPGLDPTLLLLAAVGGAAAAVLVAVLLALVAYLV